MESLKSHTAFSNLLQKTMGSRHHFSDKPTNVKTAVHVSEIVLFLLLLSWYSPTLTVAVHVAGGCILDFSRLLTRPLSVFLISNAIIVAVAVLSGEKGADSTHSETTPAPELQTPPSAAADAVVDDELSNQVGGSEEELCSMMADDVGDGNQRLHCPQEIGAGEEEEVRKNPVEELSTEEFNLTVEKYIARTKSFLHKERLDDIFKFEIGR